ncbi:MAG: 50S ribosomal protein L29 [Lewinellaceae bacterium]|nr:50S ribosomal protein L29 [Lewinellaceae bacterium]
MAQEKLELGGMADAELVETLAGMQNELQQMKFDHTVKGLPNPLELREKRREIARIRTEVRRREMAAMSADELAMRSKIRERRRRQK